MISLPRASLWWWSPAPGIYCTELKGHFCVAGVGPLLEGFRLVAEASPSLGVMTFHDWTGIKTYDSAARVAYVDQARPLMHRSASIEALVTSKIVAMGIELARIALGAALHGTADREAFEARITDAVARRRG